MSDATLHAEDFSVGQVFDLGSRFVDADEIVDFGRRWDPQPFHVDAEAARATQFGGLVASGVHSLAILQILQYEAVLRRTALIAGLGVADMHIPAPLRPSTTVAGSMEIVERRMRPDSRAVVRWTSRLTVCNEVVLVATLAALVRQRDSV